MQIWVLPFIQYSVYPKVSVPGICTNFGPCFYHWSLRLLQQPSNGLPSVHLLKRQRLQTAAARLISNVSRYSHITPVLCSLHWLSVKLRIDFKILLMRYHLRSASGVILKYPSLKLKKTFADRAFSSAASIVIYGTICPFTSVLRTVLNVLNLNLKSIFLE